MEQTEKTIEIIDKCLSYLMKVGLYKATSRELSLESGLNKTGLYYYFKSKDDVVLACAERAVRLISDNIMLPTIQEIIESTFDVNKFMSKAKEIIPMMNFLIQVYSESTYREEMTPFFSKANDMYQKYAERIASKADMDIELLRPYISSCITTISNYMIFNDETYLAPQFGLIMDGIDKVKTKRKG